MSTVDLNEWSSFRAKSLDLSNDLVAMVDAMDPIMAGNLSEAAKKAEMQSLLEEYLP